MDEKLLYLMLLVNYLPTENKIYICICISIRIGKGRYEIITVHMWVLRMHTVILYVCK